MPKTMREFFRVGLTTIVLTFVFFALAGCDEKEAKQAKEALKRMEAHSKALTSFKADIVMDRYNPQLDESDVSEGKIIYVPQKENKFLLRIDWTKPVAESLTVVDNDFLLYRPNLRQAITGKMDASRASKYVDEAMAFMNVSRKNLKANYNIRYIGNERLSNRVLTYHLEFTPKTPKNYRKAEFWIDANGMPNQIKVTENNGDTITILLSNFQKNVKVDSEIFTIKLPKNTKIVK
jgi:outer membrane lipoprotein-sorting protein